MKLTSEDTKRLKTLLQVCAIADIDSIIIEDGVIRGANESKTCAIISRAEVPNFDKKIGLSRLSALRARIDLFDSKDTVIETKNNDRGEISQIEISAARSKAQYRPTSTALIKAPSNINDEAHYELFLSKDECKSILDAVKVMGAKSVLITINDRLVTFKINDAGGDVYSIQLETPASVEPDAEDGSVTSYSADIFSAVVRAAGSADQISVIIGERGSARISVLGHILTILPQVNEGEDD